MWFIRFIIKFLHEANSDPLKLIQEPVRIGHNTNTHSSISGVSNGLSM